jgi:hypothetical protein
MVPNNRSRRLWFKSSKLDPPTDYPGRRNGKNFRKGEKTCHSGGLIPFPHLDEIHLHAVLQERLAALQRRRRGLWSKVWRFFWGD